MFEEMPSLTPIDCFSLSAEVKRAPWDEPLSFSSHRLPETSELLAEEGFAQVAMGWSQEGIVLAITVSHPIADVCYPEFSEGDALELFIDTRDVKTSGFLTRFCHHFLILPEEVQGIRALEITRFRTEDAHPLCDPKEIQVVCEPRKDSYQLQVSLPASCLHGYDPQQCNRLGFTYRIHRKGKEPQHFSVSSRDVTIEQHPRLWASLTLGE